MAAAGVICLARFHFLAFGLTLILEGIVLVALAIWTDIFYPCLGVVLVIAGIVYQISWHHWLPTIIMAASGLIVLIVSLAVGGIMDHLSNQPTYSNLDELDG